MLKSLQIVVALSVLGTMGAKADVATPRQIVERHAVNIKKADVDALMADYAANAVVVTPPGLMPSAHPASPGVFIGTDEVRKVFVVLTNKDNIGPVRSMVSHVESLPQGVAILHWVQFSGTPKQVSGEDVFTVRDGKIISQFITVEAPTH